MRGAVMYASRTPGAAVPSLVAGQRARILGLFDVALGYGALAAAACVITLAAAHDPRTSAHS
jgi:hypothetical protein